RWHACCREADGNPQATVPDQMPKSGQGKGCNREGCDRDRARVVQQRRPRDGNETAEDCDQPMGKVGKSSVEPREGSPEPDGQLVGEILVVVSPELGVENRIRPTNDHDDGEDSA